MVLLWGESFFLFTWGSAREAYPAYFFRLQMNTTEFEPKRLFMLSVYLLVMGLLLGYLSEQQSTCERRRPQ